MKKITHLKAMVKVLLPELNLQFLRERLTDQRLLSHCNGGRIKVRFQEDSLVV